MRRTAISIVILALGATASVAAPPSDGWTQWGGPTRDFTVGGEEARVAWSGGAPKLLWRRPLGPGHSAVVGDAQRLFTMTRRDDDEVILALASSLWPRLFSCCTWI